jgi:hypothetical protein
VKGGRGSAFPVPKQSRRRDRRGPADPGVVEDHNFVMGGQGVDETRRPAVHGCTRSRDEQQFRPAAQLAVRDRPGSGADDADRCSQYVRAAARPASRQSSRRAAHRQHPADQEPHVLRPGRHND